MSTINPGTRVLVSVDEAVRLIGSRDHLSDFALRGLLGLYFRVDETQARVYDALPWVEGIPSVIPEIQSRVTPTPLSDGDDGRFRIDGWFRASRPMVDELFSSGFGVASEYVDAWDEHARRWRVLSTQGHRRLGGMRLLYRELVGEDFVRELPKAAADETLDPRERKSLLLIIGALAKMAHAHQRGAAAAVYKFMADEMQLKSPQEATVRKYLKEAEETLRQHSPKGQ